MKHFYSKLLRGSKPLTTALLFAIYFIAIEKSIAQGYIPEIVYTTGGSFGADGNMVKVSSYNPTIKTKTYIDAVAGDFSNTIAIDNGHIYAHIGRSNDTDLVIKYDIETLEAIDTLRNTPGIFRIAICKNYLIASKGYGASSEYVEIFDKNDLKAGPVYSSSTSEFPEQTSHILILRDTAYIAYSQNNIGKLGIISLKDDGPEFERTMEFNELAHSIRNMFTDGEKIYILSTKTSGWPSVIEHARVTEYDPANDTYEQIIVDRATNGITLRENLIYGNFGSGLDSYDISTNEVEVTFPHVTSYTAADLDTLNNYFIFQQTNYSTFGRIVITNLLGEGIDTVNTDISGSALALNYSPFPFHPAAGKKGTSAMHKDSSAFVGWASNCTVARGPQDISNPELGNASAGTPQSAIGLAGTNGVVSLGDGGHAILTFDNPIKNGPGNDFAVFENSFSDSFLELAFVEVSSDGETFFRFDAISLTQTDEQVESFGALDARQIHNLAGKYRALYGTPFDLEELKDKPGLDVDNITHVKIIDVVGNIDNTYATYDSYGNKVNDPWPTAFASGGFDLDAVGVIHQVTSISKSISQADKAHIFPNPLQQGEALNIKFGSNLKETHRYEILNISGELVHEEGLNPQSFTINTQDLKKGIYFLRIFGTELNITKKLIIQ